MGNRFAKGGPGRKRKVSDEVRDNGYRDAEGKAQVTELKPWHERIVDYMLTNPSAKIVDLAEVFGVSPQWMGQLMQTDMFKQYYSERMGAYRDFMHERIVTGMQETAVKGIDTLHSKMSVMSPTEAMQATELMLKGLGIVNRPGAGPVVQINNQGGGQMNVLRASPQALERAKKKWQEQNAQGPEEGLDEGLYMQVTSDLKIPEPEGDEVIDAVVLGDDVDDSNA